MQACRQSNPLPKTVPGVICKRAEFSFPLSKVYGFCESHSNQRAMRRGLASPCYQMTSHPVTFPPCQ